MHDGLLHRLDPPDEPWWKRFMGLANALHMEGERDGPMMAPDQADPRVYGEMALDMTPGVGDVKALVYDLPRDVEQGNYLMAGLSGLSAIPVAGLLGDVGRRLLKRVDDLPEVGRAARTTSEALNMRKLKTLDEVREVLGDQPAYIRYSRFPDKDIERGFSRRPGGQEAGLSFNELPDPEDYADDDYMARILGEYEFLRRRDPDARAWLARGDVAGRGMDNEPLLSNPEPLAELSPELLDQIRAYRSAWNKWRREMPPGPVPGTEYAKANPQPRFRDFAQKDQR